MLTPAQFITLCFTFLFCLGPVSFYLCWLAGVNRRHRPTTVSGAWDFVGVLAALSTCLITGGVMLLEFASRVPGLSQSMFQVGHATAEAKADLVTHLFTIHWVAWLVLLAVYGGLLALVTARGVRKRRHWLSVYNLDAVAADRVISAAVERCGLAAKREGNVWTDGRPLVEAHTFHGTGHTTIRLLCPDARQREDLDRHLRSEIASVENGSGPAGPWFTSLAVGTVIVVVGMVGLIGYFVFIR